LIVGTKIDLRDDPSAKGPIVSRKDGEKLAKEVGAAGYLEVSALKRTGIQELFEEVARQGLKAIGE
jgi:GTPase SAR1 family protein